jgi:hypothetical protein
MTLLFKPVIAKSVTSEKSIVVVFLNAKNYSTHSLEKYRATTII